MKKQITLKRLFVLFVLTFYLGILVLFGIYKYFTWDDTCLDTWYCKEGTQLNGCTICGDPCVITRENCASLGGEWLEDRRLCHLGIPEKRNDWARKHLQKVKY